MFFRGESSVRQIQHRNGKEAEGSVFEVHGSLHVDGGFRRVKFPGGPVRIAHRHPGFVDFVGVFVDALGFLRFEINGIRADQQSGRLPALDGEGSTDLVENSAAGYDFVARVFGFDMLGQIIELHVAVRDDDLSIFVVLHVIRA